MPNRKQRLLLTEIDLDSIAPVGSAQHYIDELVEMLDTGAIEGTYDLESEQGRNPIHPKRSSNWDYTLSEIVDFLCGRCRMI